MKKLNKAFTLAELLLCLGIIGVVSAMGMVIAKHGTDRAYNLFYYNGYINIYNAIADAKAVNANATNAQIMEHVKEVLDNQEEAASNHKTIEVANSLLLLSNKAVIDGIYIAVGREYEVMNKDDVDGEIYVPSGPTVDPDDLREPNTDGMKLEHMSGDSGVVSGKDDDDDDDDDDDNGGLLLGDAEWPGSDNENSEEIIATNGVRIYYPSNLDDGLNGLEGLNGVSRAIPITITVPQRKTRVNNGIATIHLAYVDLDNGYLIPINDEESSVNLQDRRDLLPAYIDDGKVGRNNAINRNDFEFEPIRYGSFREAFCTARNGNGLNPILSCNGVTLITPRNGVLKFADPRKAR